MKNSLRTRMVSAFVFMIVVLLVSALYSIYKFGSLSQSIGNIMRSNYDSIIAAQNMNIALERQDSNQLHYMFDQNKSAVQTIRENEKSFLKWLALEQGNITEPQEGETADRIDDLYGRYLEHFNRLVRLKDEQGQTIAREYYYKNLLPIFSSIKSELRRIEEINQQAMLVKKDQAQRSARDATAILLAVSFISALVAALVGFYLTHQVIGPLRQLLENVQRIARGDYSQKLAVSGQDEIAQLSSAFNTMAQRLEEFRDSNVKRLLTESRKTQDIVKSIRDPLIVTSPEDRLILINEAAQSLLKLPRKNLLQQNLSDIIAHPDILRNIHQALTYGTLYEMENVPLEQDGRRRTYRIYSSPLRDSQDQDSGVITILQDITKLKEVDQLKNDFIFTVSHEFRTPLTSLLMSAELLLDGSLGTLREDQTEVLQMIAQDGQRLKNLVNDLLDLSRIQSGKAVYDFSRLNLSSLVQSAISSFRSSAQLQGIDLRLYVDPYVPPVQGDAAKLTLVLNNLLANAIKFVSPPHGKVEVSLTAQPGWVLVRIQDNGPGVPDAYKERIFDKFVQAPAEKKREGSGLGLSISKEIVKAHQGTLSVEDAPRQGSIFTLRLPEAPPDLSKGGIP